MSRYIAYIIAPPKQNHTPVLFATDELSIQEKRIRAFLNKSPGELFGTFVEVGTTPLRQRHKWPELKSALKACYEHQADLVIGEIRNLTQNDAFAECLNEFVESGLQIYCLDQPYINRTNLKPIIEHNREQKRYHAILVKEGLAKTQNQPGNPHATEVINQVNKPKTDNSIAFSLLMMPIIYEYQNKKYSQRKMVDMLNEEGFTAPEGGHWVLSQLQKVLCRIKMNEAAFSLEKKFLEFQDSFDPEYIAKKLNQSGRVPPKGKSWTVELVQEVKNRIEQIHDIIRMNELILELMPLLEESNVTHFDVDLIEKEFEKAGIKLPNHWQKNSSEGLQHG